jgi:hypothetical protein
MKAAFLSFLCTIILTSYAQIQPWECIKTDGDCCAFAKSITSDALGNSYVTGWFNSNSIALGKGALKLSAKKNGGNMSIVKYDAKGNALWARGTGSTEDTPPLASVTDKEGNSYVTGLLGNPSDTDSKVLNSLSKDTLNRVRDTLVDRYDPEMSVLKYDTKGNIIWLKREGVDKKSTSIAVDKNKNVYVGGWFVGEYVSFGSILLRDTGSNDKNLFIVKYDPSGNVSWAKIARGKGFSEATAITTDLAGNILVTGVFIGTAKFDTISLTSENGYYDIFIVKYNQEGKVVWAKSNGGSFSDYSTSIAVDQNGNSFVSGYFSGYSMKLGENNLKNKKESSSMDDFNIFVAKYDSKGNVLWAKNADNNGYGYPDKLAVRSDKLGNCYLGGNFEGGSFIFDGKELNTHCTSTTNFILKLNGTGKIVWLKNIGHSECDALASFHIDPKQNCKVIIGSPQRFRTFAFNAN